jgi:hypothetical protein
MVTITFNSFKKIRKIRKTLWVYVPLLVLVMMMISCSKNESDTNPSELIVSITDFSPKRADVGVEITITGKNFDPVMANDIVKINGMAVEVIKASSTSLSITIPKGATSGKITVTTKTGTATSVEELTVIIPKTI